MIKTNWEYSREIEAKRIIHTASQIANGFFRINGFELRARWYDGIKPFEVIFPDLPYLKIPRFWQKVRQIGHSDLPITADKTVVDEVSQLLKDAKTKEPNYSHIKDTWNKANSDVISTIYEILPSYKNFINEVTFFPSNFGTVGSFNLLSEDRSHLKMHLRFDQPLCEVVRIMLLSLTRTKVFKEYKGLWSESQLLGEWLLLETKLKDVVNKYDYFENKKLLINASREYVKPGSYASDLPYYKKLGVPLPEKGFFVRDDNSIMFDDIKLVNLTSTEEDILAYLVNRKHEVVSLDELASIMFSKEEEFSLYAISKALQRIRDNLELNGISGSFIKTVRNKGFTIHV